MKAFHETPSTGPAAAMAAAMQALIPVLETEHLTLRAPRIEDFDAFVEASSGERAKYYGDYANRAEAWQDFIQLTGTWLLRGHGVWTVVDKQNETVLGFVHLGAEPGDHEPELGFIVTEAAEGKSIAYEAAEAVRKYAFETLRLKTMVSYIEPGNERSVALATRLGGWRDTATEATFPENARPLVYRHDQKEGRA